MLALALLGLLAAATTAPHAAAVAAADEDRSLATLSLNTLTTSCNGGCKTNSACVVLGQSSENPINCVSDARCATLLSGKAALCMEPFVSSASVWTFAPAKTSTVAGVAPFERVGLVQVAEQVRTVEFKIASSSLAPLPTLDVSSLNVQSASTLEKVSFGDLVLTGFDGALPVNGALKVAINNCRLQTIPTQFVASSKVTDLDLSNNLITAVPTDFQNQAFPALTSLDLSKNALTTFGLTPKNFPALTSLVLSDNQLREFPSTIFSFPSLKTLTLDGNPPSMMLKLTAEQFAFLAKINSLKLTNGSIETDVCPGDDVVSKLNASVKFCVGGKNATRGGGSSSGGNSSTGTVVTMPPTTVPTVSVEPVRAQTKAKSDSSSTLWIVLGIALGCVVLLVLVCIVYRRKRQRNELPKLTNSVTPSIAIGMGDLAEHPYMELNAPSSCSQTTSDFELLANVADGYIALTRLSYNDVFLHRMIRVSSRSELWFGEYMDASVIIKKIKSNAASKTVLREFVTEIEHMVELKHARIAAFKGAMWDNEGTELCAVVEYVEHGALRDCIASSVGLSGAQQLAIARQIVDAVGFLHQKRIVHGRLNSFNVLLDKHYGAKLSLFAIFHYVKLSPLDAECGVFAAPEVLRGGQATEKSDVYSLGVILVELDTGENPVINSRRSMTGESPPSDAVERKIGFRLSVNCTRVMRDVISACLERDPARRPTMAEVAVALKTGSLM